MNRLLATFITALNIKTLLSALLLFIPIITAAKDINPQRSGLTIVVGGDHNYPPYEFINSQGKPDGYNTELTLAIADVMGLDIEVQLGVWDEMRSGLKQGDINVLQGMVYSPQRSEIFDFSPAHAIINQSIFARKGSPRIASLEELSGSQVIVQKGGIMHDYLLQQEIDVQLIFVETHAAALRLLASGEHDYALVANLPGLYLGRELELSNISPVGNPFNALEYGYAVPTGESQLLAQFSEGLAILKNTGRQQEIYDRWLGPLEQPQLPWQTIGLITALVSALLLIITGGITIWNRMLTRQVLLRTEDIRLKQEQLLQADKMTSLGVLVAGVAHEINNPSSLLLLNLPLIKEMYRDIEPILELHYNEHGDFPFSGLTYKRLREDIPIILDDMLVSTKRIRSIVSDLRDFAHQRPTDTFENVDLNSVLAVSVRLLNNIINQSTANFSVEYAKELPKFTGNAQQIEQVIVNLIVNACQALQQPDQAISLTTFYNEKEKQVCLEVTDYGRGIDEKDLTRLSDPFFTTKREQGGTGLGLSISFTIIKNHHGTLTYSSVLGEKTTALISLPIKEEVIRHDNS